MTEKCRILIVDDHPIVQEGIQTLLEKEPSFEVLGIASNGREAVEMTQTLKPDIVILDIAMPGTDGLSVASQLHESSDPAKILVYSMTANKEYVSAFFRIGVNAYVLKEDPISAL